MTITQDRDEPISKGEYWLLAIGGLIVVVFLFLANSLAHGFVEWIGVFGVGVTIAAVFVAGAIYFNQRRSSAASERRMSKTIELGLATKVKDDTSDDKIEAEPDNFPPGYADLGAPVSGEPEVLRLLRDEVPLQLIRDLVVGWEQANEDGSWNVGDLRLVLRRRGKGNHAWWFVFSRPGGNRVLKLSRGGRGNGPDDISVRDMTT